MIRNNWKKAISIGGRFNSRSYSKAIYSSSSFNHKLIILLKSKSKQTFQVNKNSITSEYD